MSIAIHNIGGFMINNYVLDTPLGLIAIDTGFPGGEKCFLHRLDRLGGVQKLRYIFLTHAHDDHAGFLQALLNLADHAQVVLHPLAVPRLKTGRNEEPPGAGYATRLAALFSLVKKDFGFPPADVADRAVLVSPPDGGFFKSLGLPIEILFLKGHTPDSIGLYLPETGDLFCGDAAMNLVLSLGHHTIWIEDVPAFSRSWDAMLSLNPIRILPAHGKPFPPTDLQKYRRFMDGRSLIVPKKQ